MGQRGKALTGEIWRPKEEHRQWFLWVVFFSGAWVKPGATVTHGGASWRETGLTHRVQRRQPRPSGVKRSCKDIGRLEQGRDWRPGLPHLRAVTCVWSQLTEGWVAASGGWHKWGRGQREESYRRVSILIWRA